MTRSTRHRTARARRRPADRVRARPRLEGLEDRCVLSPAITEFPVPTTGAEPYDITAGPDGNLWFTDIGDDEIGMINPATDAIAEFPVPTANASPRGIATGPDGNLWFTEFDADQIGMINPTTHAITEFPIPTAGAEPYNIAAGPDGNLWFTEVTADKIGEFNPTTHTFTQFTVPTGGAFPCGITAGPDGNLWFTEEDVGKVAEINPTTDAITEFAVPSGSVSGGITAGPDGNLWFTEIGVGNVAEINPTTHAITEFAAPDADGISAGPDGNVWFTEVDNGKIGTLNLTSHAVTEYPIPYAGTRPIGITTGPDGNVWFADRGNGSIGVVTSYSTNLVVTQPPPASVTAGSGFGLTVQAQDNSGNLVSSFNGTVTVALASNPGGATLGGTLTVTASGGVATFSGLTLNKAASGYTLVATSSDLGQGVTSAMTVTPASATQLVITQQPPATVKLSSAFALQASIEDAYGNVVTTASGRVSVAFANNPTGATLGGTLTVTASQGVASFTNLTINKVGSGYTLRVSSSRLTAATSSSINVTKTGQTASTLFAPIGNTATDLSMAPLVLDSPDLWDGLGFKKHARSI